VSCSPHIQAYARRIVLASTAGDREAAQAAVENLCAECGAELVLALGELVASVRIEQFGSELAERLAIDDATHWIDIAQAEIGDL